MPILTNIIVTALAVGGVSTHTIAEEHIYDFYDPLNYLMQNYVDHSNQYSYHEKIKELEDNDFTIFSMKLAANEEYERKFDSRN